MLNHKPDILHYYARTHAGHLHAYGKGATSKLIAAAGLLDGEQVLEIGFGTGATLVALASANQNLKLFGVERSPLMKKTAAARLSFCGIGNVELNLMNDDHTLPYANNIFDKIIVESVFGILADHDLEMMIAEVTRVMKPHGKLCMNETIWLHTTPKELIADINTRGLALFGIIQSNGTYAYPDDWKKLLNKNGFNIARFEPLHTINHAKGKRNHIALRSSLYSALGKIRSLLNATLRREKKEYQKLMHSLNTGKQLMEGYLILAEKSGSL